MRRILLVSALFLVACPGPRPRVESVRLLAPERPSDGWTVDVAVQNTGRGEGSVTLTVRLVEKGSGRRYQKQDHLQMKGHETLHARVRVDAPAGDYTPEAEAEYPQK